MYYITSQRSDKQQGSLPGRQLSRDLTQLAEDISSGEMVDVTTLSEPVWTTDQLAERMNVSTRTISRWRRLGLPGRKVRFLDGRVRVAFTEQSVQQFARQNSALVRRGREFTGLTATEKRAVVQRARDLVRKRHMKVHAAAGMPFSDPLAEGLPIQQSSARALGHGVKMEDAFRTAEQFRAHSETPLLLMGYVNPILRYGVSNFCQAARSSGVDGLILPDLPPEESHLVAGQAQQAGLDMVYLIAPNTPDHRIAEIDALASGFVYAVSITGITGSGLGDRLDAVAAYLQRARRLVQHNPVLVGFGIKTHADAMRLSRHTDGFIVGSALIRLIERLWDDASLTPNERLRQVQHFAQALKYGEDVMRET